MRQSAPQPVFGSFGHRLAKDAKQHRFFLSLVQGFGEMVIVQVEAEHDAAVRLALPHGGGERFAAVEAQHVAGAQATGVFGQHLPGAVRQRAVERDADMGVATAGGELRRDDAGVVGDQQITRAQQPGEVADM